MNTLVTGGAGFIGSHLVDRLLADGHTVTVLDNFSNGKWENLEHHKGKKMLRVVEWDISRHPERPEGVERVSPLDSAVARGSRRNARSRTGFFAALRMTDTIDWLFHLAALADIVPSIVHPLEYHRANVDGTVNILEAARAAGVARFIYAASSSCYGIPDVYPTPETAPIRPMYPYAFTKWVGEQYVLHWGKIYHLPVLSLRFFNVYGPRSRTSGTYGAVFGTFLAQKLAGKPFTVVGDGTQTRDFTYVTDVVDALVKAAESPVTNEVFNVGSGRPQSVNRLVQLLGGDVVHIPKRPGEPDCTQADIRKIRKTLGWKPTVPFETGVQEMLKHIDYWRQAPVWTPEKINQATQEWFTYLSKE